MHKGVVISEKRKKIKRKLLKFKNKLDARYMYIYITITKHKAFKFCNVI